MFIIFRNDYHVIAHNLCAFWIKYVGYKSLLIYGIWESSIVDVLFWILIHLKNYTALFMYYLHLSTGNCRFTKSGTRRMVAINDWLIDLLIDFIDQSIDWLDDWFIGCQFQLLLKYFLSLFYGPHYPRSLLIIRVHLLWMIHL